MRLYKRPKQSNNLFESVSALKSSDDLFDLDKIPMELLDKAAERYHPYTLDITYGNPLSTKRVNEGTDYRKQINEVKEAVMKTFPIFPFQFKIREGNHGMFAAILAYVDDDNVDIVENVMKKQSFFRSQPTDENLLRDRKNRKWIDMRFEPVHPDDITNFIHKKYKYVFHLTPEYRVPSIYRDGFFLSTASSKYKYSEGRVYFMEGDSTEEDIQRLVNNLYNNLIETGLVDPTDNYTLLKLDLDKMDSSIRFFYDINEPKGIYTKVPVPPDSIVGENHYVANVRDNEPDDLEMC